MKVFRLYLFSQLEQRSKDALFPGALMALTAQIALLLLVLVCCYLLMLQVCGEDTSTKATPSLGIINMENPLFQAVSSVASLCASADGHSLSASLVFQAFPSVSPSVP